MDIMAINKIQFMVTTSRNIRFGTAECIHITSCLDISGKRFSSAQYIADGAFKFIRNRLSEMGLALNVT